MRITKLVAAIASLAFLGVASTQAAPIPWAQPSGATAGFTYDSGNTDNQLFVPAGDKPGGHCYRLHLHADQLHRDQRQWQRRIP